MRQAEALDPLSPIIKFNLLTWLGYSRQYQPALELCERYLKDFPDFALFHAGRGWLLERLGRYPEAVTELLIARGTVTNTPYFLGMVGYMYARAGDGNNARKVLTELEAWKNKGYAVRGDMAQVRVGLREFDSGMDEFEAAFANGEALSDLLVDPTMDELRDTPRFQALAQKMGLRK